MKNIFAFTLIFLTLSLVFLSVVTITPMIVPKEKNYFYSKLKEWING